MKHLKSLTKILIFFLFVTMIPGSCMQLAEEIPLEDRIINRDFPSVFQAWNRADNLDEDPLITLARHDLIFHSPEGFKLEWNNAHTGLANGFSPESMERGKAFRASVMEKNPNMIMLAEIRYRDAPARWLPEDHEWWLRDSMGELVYGWKEGGFIRLDLNNPDFQDRVAEQAAAAVESGVLDGVMLDWWNENEFPEARIAIAEKVRKAIGEKALIIANSNDREIPLTAKLINGLFMECYRSESTAQWEKIRTTLVWAEANLREPRINCLENWFDKSRDDLYKMRATTTLVLCNSDGYCLFSDPNPLPVADHLHNWYDFWEPGLGKAKADGFLDRDGTWKREFDHGMVVYNPMGNEKVELKFDRDAYSRANGKQSAVHSLEPNDGDIYIYK